MISQKIILVALMLILSTNALSRHFELSNQQLDNLSKFARDNEYVKKDDFKHILVTNIIQAMEEAKWTSENFPTAFADIISNNLYGREIELPGAELEKLIAYSNIGEMYNKYFKQIIAVLAKELSNKTKHILKYKTSFFIFDQDANDLAENIEHYSLSYDSFYIFQYQFPRN